MSQKVEQFKEREIEGKLKAWISKGVQFLELESSNVKPLRYIYYSGDKSIKIEYSVGFGASEQIKKIEFNRDLLTEKLNLFTSKKIIDNELKLTFINPPKIKNYLEMSDSTKNNIKGLQDHLFNAIKKLEGGTMNSEQAKAMAQLAQTIINSAKLEIDYKKMLSDTPSVPLLD